MWMVLTPPESARAADEAPGRDFSARQTAASAIGAPPASVSIAATGSSDADFENRPLSFPSSANPQARRSGAEKAAANPGLPSIFPLFFYIAAVCAVFVGVLYLAKRYLPGHRQLFSHPAVEILGRTHLDQKRYISLLRVGKRVLVIGVSPDEIGTLSEITDEAEVTGILEEARPKTESGKALFGRLFKRHVLEAEREETRLAVELGAREIESQATMLREKVGAVAGVPEGRAARARPSGRMKRRELHVDKVG
ncbi:MAG: flagellar biosynthetic protein FliO [Planctomycetota bacterium]|nr:flagellar biosynthetic protein FliO [Planctomycetota bacterium]